MQVIYEKRGNGKSTEIIKRSVETNSYVIVATQSRANSLKKQAENLGFPQMLFPVTVNEYLSTKMRGSKIKNVLIDDADLVLQTIFNTVQIDAISLTKE